MESSEIEAFLVLAEELHFGRAAERLRLSQSRVSRLIATLERKTGGALFERTSRQVALTPLGKRLRDQVEPAWAQIEAALAEARDAARNMGGILRLGWPVTVGSPVLSRLAETFTATYPECGLTIHDVPLPDVYGPLRGGEIDMVAFWLADGEPDLTVGPVLEYRPRVLAAARGHRLARRESVSVEDLADEEVHDNMPDFPAGVFDALVPPATPSGRPIRRTVPWRSVEEIVVQIARGRIVQPTVAGVVMYQRDDIRLVPIRDLPPLQLGLIWRSADENTRIRGLAGVARKIGPRPDA